MKSFSWTLALRYLNPLRTFVSIITLISLLGVAMGVMVLIVVLSVHNGFERNLKETLLGFSPHISLYSGLGGGISDWVGVEAGLTADDEVEGAYGIVEGFVLLDSQRWQRPVMFRAVNAENPEQMESLRGMLDPDYPGSVVDLNMGGDQNAVISRQLAEGLGLELGEEIRILAASNLDAVMAVYNVPSERAWDLYGEVFEGLEDRVGEVFGVDGDEEKALAEEVTELYRRLQVLVSVEIENEEGEFVMREGKEMRKVEERLIFEVLDLLDGSIREESGLEYYEIGVEEAILGLLGDLRELDLEKADNEAFREIEDLVVPKTLVVQGVYRDNKRSHGPEVFVSLTIGQELKGLRGEVEAIGLLVKEPYRAEQTARRLQEEMGEDWVVRSWMVTHAQQFQLVKTEKLMMSFALSFIGLLSAFSIMAVMYTVTVQKRQEIGVMKALGARPSQIVRVFVYQGWIVGMGGALLGLGMGFLALKYREGIVGIIRKLGVDPFPAEFHGMAEMPALVVWEQVWVICVMAVVLCLLAALFPALLAAFRDPAKSLRNL